MPVRILLADDHEIVRHGLKALLEREGFNVVGEASDGREAARLAATLHPDAAVLDLAMPILNGLAAAEEILRCPRPPRIILLTMHTEDHLVLASLRAGVSGYVLKSRASDELLQAIREALRGHCYLSPGISRTVVNAFLARSPLPVDPLTSREKQVLQLIAEGKTTKETAAELGITFKTAECHRTRIMQKLGIHETAGLVRYALRSGLTQL
jgi:DNA-binding NarL/FixJ family response regulator